MNPRQLIQIFKCFHFKWFSNVLFVFIFSFSNILHSVTFPWHFNSLNASILQAISGPYYMQVGSSVGGQSWFMNYWRGVLTTLPRSPNPFTVHLHIISHVAKNYLSVPQPKIINIQWKKNLYMFFSCTFFNIWRSKTCTGMLTTKLISI